MSKRSFCETITNESEEKEGKKRNTNSFSDDSATKSAKELTRDRKRKQRQRQSENQKNELKETKLLDLDAMKKFDDMKLSQILNLRSYEIVNDEEAADFIENIDKTSKNTLEDKKPDLPL